VYETVDGFTFYRKRSRAELLADTPDVGRAKRSKSVENSKDIEMSDSEEVSVPKHESVSSGQPEGFDGSGVGLPIGQTGGEMQCYGVDGNALPLPCADAGAGEWAEYYNRARRISQHRQEALLFQALEAQELARARAFEAERERDAARVIEMQMRAQYYASMASE
jgi:hypothetical protein